MAKVYENLTTTELLRRVNSIEAAANERGLVLSFLLREYSVSGTVYEKDGYNLDKIYQTERIQPYNPINRDAGEGCENIYDVLSDLMNFVITWKGHEVETLSKEVKELEEKLTAKRKELAIAEKKVSDGSNQ